MTGAKINSSSTTLIQIGPFQSVPLVTSTNAFRYSSTPDQVAALVFSSASAEPKFPSEFRIYYSDGSAVLSASTLASVPKAPYSGQKTVNAIPGDQFVLIDTDTGNSTPNVKVYKLSADQKSVDTAKQWTGLQGFINEDTSDIYYFRQAVWYETFGFLGVLWLRSNGEFCVNFYLEGSGVLASGPFVVGTTAGMDTGIKLAAAISTTEPPRTAIMANNFVSGAQTISIALNEFTAS